MKVHEGDDVDPFGLDAIQEPVRKLWNQKPPEPPAERCAGGRKLEQSLVRLLNGTDEVEAQPLRLALVEPSCRNELILRFRMKLEPS